MTTIRSATTADAAGLAEVRVRGWQVGYEGIVDAGYLAAMSVDEDQARWTNGIAAGRPVLVAIIDDRVIGFATFGPYRAVTPLRSSPSDSDVDGGEPVGELFAFYVHPDSWGRGVANELHDAAVVALRAAGWNRLKLWVLEDNRRARRFYERHGWVNDGGRQRLSVGGEPTEVRYELVSRASTAAR